MRSLRMFFSQFKNYSVTFERNRIKENLDRLFQPLGSWPRRKKKLPKYKNRIDDLEKNFGIYFLKKAMKYFNNQFHKL